MWVKEAQKKVDIEKNKENKKIKKTEFYKGLYFYQSDGAAASTFTPSLNESIIF